MTWVGALAAVALASAILLKPSRGAEDVQRVRALVRSHPRPVPDGVDGLPASVSPARGGGRALGRGRTRRRASGRVPGRASGWVFGLMVDRVLHRRRGADGATCRELAALLDAIAAALDAGLPVGAALECAGDVSELGGPSSVAGVIVEAGRRGDVQAGVWDDLATALQDTGAADLLRGVAQVWRICESTGSPMAAALRRAAAAARTRSHQAARLAVATAGPRATIRLLTALPLIGPAGVLMVWSGGPVPVGVATVAAASIGAGLVLLVVGHRWAGRIVARACLPALAAPAAGGSPRGGSGRA